MSDASDLLAELVAADLRIKELESENQRLREAVGWRPIETYRGGEVVLFYPAEPENILTERVVLGRLGGYRKPTHWMPIPEPPSSGEVGK